MGTKVKNLFEKFLPPWKNMAQEFERLFGPQIKHPYFQKRLGIPLDFQYDATSFEMGNAAWLADAALLAYVPSSLDDLSHFNIKGLKKNGWSKTFVGNVLKQSGFPHVKNFNSQGTQLFVAHNSQCIVVAFRGTEVQEILDLLYDAKFIPSKEGNGRVHGGFQAGLDAVWKGKEGGVEGYLKRITKNTSLPVWFTGHSLGAALAVLAASRWKKIGNVQGLYTFGSPGVGNKSFVQGLNGLNAFRFVHNQDIVTKVSQDNDLLHVGDLRVINVHKNIIKKSFRPVEREKLFPKLPTLLLRESLKSFKAPIVVGKKSSQIPAWLTDHAPKFYSKYIRETV